MIPDDRLGPILFEDFSRYDVGAFSEEVTAVHETHYLRRSIDQGPWTETSVYHTNRTPNVNIQWVIAERNGRKVLQQTGINWEGVFSWRNVVRRHVLRRDICPILFFPSLATGAESWRNYRLEVSCIPETWRLCGTLFRAKNAMQHYVFGLERGRVRLMLREFNKLVVLASRRHSYAPGARTTLTVTLEGDSIRCRADDQEVFTIQDSSLPGGGCGILANGPATFESVTVRMTSADRVAMQADAAARTARTADTQRLHPAARLVKRLALPVSPSGRSMRFGDLSGGGQLEFVIAQVGNDRGSPEGALGLTAVDSAGRVMWQKGPVQPDGVCRISDVPVQICDFDGDGRNEVLCFADGRLQVLDGATGSLKTAGAGPSVGASDGTRVFPCDSLFVCNLTGNAWPADVLIKDMYSEVHAYDRNLEPLWHHQGKTGHYPFAFDVDGDGRDEVLIGYTLLSPNGRPLWRLRMNDHADAVAVIRSMRTGDLVVAIAASDEGFVLADTRGRERKHLRLGHMQTITAARLVAGADDFQIATNTYWGNPGVIYILGLDGALINVFQPSIHGSPISPVRWTRQQRDFLLVSAAAGPEGGLYDAGGTQVVALPEDGHPELCYFVMDVDGDGLEEIICWDHDELWIYRSEETGTGACQAPVRLPSSCNQSNYRSQVTLRD